MTTEWTDEELKQSVRTYLDMLNLQETGQSFKKSEFNEKLRGDHLPNRTKASVEYRMQNISAVLDEIGMPTIRGYLPAKNIGTQSKEKIRTFLSELQPLNQEDFHPTADIEELELRTEKLRASKILNEPVGQKDVTQVSITAFSYVRDPAVKAWVLQDAGGVCQGCRQPAPFALQDGMPFLEVHHVKWLAQGGSDTPENAVALCPNCHRRCHFSADRENFKESLYNENQRLIRE